MALINCPECGKEVSNRAVSCPNCGLPLQNNPQTELTGKQELVTTENDTMILSCPEFPSNLNIGQPITNWSFDSAFKGIYDQSLNVVKNIPSGNAQILLHTHGIRIMIGLFFYPIHNSQIINIQKTTSTEIAKTNKSVIGRAVVGGLIMGPLGAVVGGISGTGTKDKLQINQCVIINFWDIQTRSAQSILILCDNSQPIDAFINRQKKEAQKNIVENRMPEQEHIPIWAILCLAIIVICVFSVFVSMLS